MLEGLINLMMTQEIAKSQAETQVVIDAHNAKVEEKKAADAAAAAANAKKVITYDVSVRGQVSGDLEEFRRVTWEVLNDPRGWTGAGVRFEEVNSGGRMHMILASPQEVYNASPWGCSTEWSCTVKPSVLINDERWMHATDTYNNSNAGTISNYRQMVINHEVGHFLGHDHLMTCEPGSNLAPIMVQQSIDLRGCSINPWPLASELWVSGI